MRKKRTLASMTKSQKAKYHKEFKKLRSKGVSTWAAIRFARRVAFGEVKGLGK